MLGTITSIEEVKDLSIAPVTPVEGKGGRLGLSPMIYRLIGEECMDGYCVKTTDHTYYVLIDNGQSCCESWGYLSSDDDLTAYSGAELQRVSLTDTALHKERVEASGYYEDAGGIQFVDFVTSRGTFQLAVYNGHNGYYGHGIVVAQDEDILLQETL